MFHLSILVSNNITGTIQLNVHFNGFKAIRQKGDALQQHNQCKVYAHPTPILVGREVVPDRPSGLKGRHFKAVRNKGDVLRKKMEK